MFTLSDNFWKRLNLLAGLFVLLATFGLLVFVANLEIKDLDLWLHIGVGRYIVQHGFQVPTVDILSCTVAGTPWVNHEWLFQVIVYLIYNKWGAEGLIDMQVALVSLTLFILAFLGFNRKNQLPNLLALFLVSLVYQTRFTIRPDLYSLFFFTLTIVILALFIHRRWSVWALFVIQVLWANMHGFFFLGPLLVAIGLFGEWLKRTAILPVEWKEVGRLTDDEYRRMKVALIVVLLACFLTPTGIHGAIYPLKVLFEISGESRVFFTKIIELQRPITGATVWNVDEWPYYKLLIVLSAISFFLNRRKIDVGILLFWLFFLAFSLTAVRNLVFFAFAAYLVIVTNLVTINFRDIIPLRFTSKKMMYLTLALAHALIVVWALKYYKSVADNGYFDFDTYERKSEFGGISQRQYPTKAVDFMVNNKLRGNFFNDFNSGAYIVGRCHPDIKVFIDGRTEVYGPDFFNAYRNMLEGDNSQKFQSFLKRFQITGAFFNSVQNPIPEKIINDLYKDRDWVVVYFDHDGVIFLKNVAVNRPVINKHRIDLTKWKAQQMDLYRLGAKAVTPQPNFNRAFTLEALGLSEQAAAEARAALKVSPGYSGPYKLLGKIAARKKDFAEAYENFRIAASLSFYDQSARLNMALALTDLKKYDEAAVQYQKIIDIWPNLARAHFKLAKVQIYRKKFPQALAAVSQGFKLDSKAGADALAIADQFAENKAFDPARQTYEMLLAKDPKKEQAYLKLSRLYERQGRKDKAIEVLKKGLAKLPESKEIGLKLRALGVKS